MKSVFSIGMITILRKSVSEVGERCIRCRRNVVLTKKIQFITSGIIVTGDEVLKGQVMDTNSYFLCRNLYEMGIKVLAVSKVADDVSVISSEVKSFSNKYDYVLTTGGIGPTHDDVTYEAVAKAFNDELHYHPDLTKLVLDFYQTNDLAHPALKMAYVPKTAKLTFGFDPNTKKKTLYPNVSVYNVFMFPGVPYLCERIFSLAKNELFPDKSKFYVKELFLRQNEGDIVEMLNKAVKKYSNVLFGSYPKFSHSYYKVKITLESVVESEVNEAFEFLKNLIPKEYLTDYDPDPFSDKKSKIARFQQNFFRDTLQNLKSLLESSHPNHLFLYFDGGKNSTALLYIWAALHEELYPGMDINGIYVESNPKVNKFVTETSKKYNLNLLRMNEANFKSFASCSPNLRIIKGTRESDPDACHIFKYFEELPVFNPILKWRYADVWNFIRKSSLPYCELYDQGYTSICHIDSSPNPNLKTSGPRADLVYYKKAFELEDEVLENVR